MAAFTLLISAMVQGETITINKAEGIRNELIVKILKLALSKSDPSASVRQQPEEWNEARSLEGVKAGQLSLMWAGTQPQYEQELLPVRIPVLKGLLGHRIFIIRRGEQPRFDQIHTLEQLKQLKAGQGTLWGDTQILKANGIPVVPTIKYSNLFPMLEGGRFDYFPRAVHEPWNEVREYAELNLTVEKHLLLIYPFCMYFFVAPENQALHDKIQRGFEAAIRDGSFDALFFNNPMIQEVLSAADLRQRTVFRLSNPDLHPATPLDRPEFWLDISTL